MWLYLLPEYHFVRIRGKLECVTLLLWCNSSLARAPLEYCWFWFNTYGVVPMFVRNSGPCNYNTVGGSRIWEFHMELMSHWLALSGVMWFFIDHMPSGFKCRVMRVVPYQRPYRVFHGCNIKLGLFLRVLARWFEPCCSMSPCCYDKWVSHN